MARLFGTDGVRGEANVTLLPEMAYRLGRAATLYFGRESDEQPLILIGRDTRISGEMFASALTAGICSAGAPCTKNSNPRISVASKWAESTRPP